MASYFSITPNREAIFEESICDFSGRQKMSSPFDLVTQEEKQNLIRKIIELENFNNKTFGKRSLINLSSIELMTFSELRTTFQDLNAEIIWKKNKHIKKIQSEHSRDIKPRESLLKQENIIWIDTKVSEIKIRSRTQEDDVETGTATAKELDEIRQEMLEDLSEEDGKVVNAAAKRNESSAELERQEEELRLQQLKRLREEVQNRMEDPRYHKDPQFQEETNLLAKPFFDDSQTKAEIETEFHNFVKKHGYNREETQLVVLRRESRSPEAYGPVQISSALRAQFYALHAEANGQERWLEEMQKKLSEAALKTARDLTEEVCPIKIRVTSDPYEELMPILKGAPGHKPKPSQEAKKEVQFAEKVSARVLLPGDVSKDADIPLEKTNLEDSKW